MDIGTYADDLRRQLLLAAENGSGEARAAAERMAAQLEASVRLVLLDALTAAAGEITRDLAPGSVDVRLRGREVELVVDVGADAGRDDRPVGSVDLDDTSTSRTTLRLPDALKAQVDEAAAADGTSVNAWLVRAVASALQPKARRAAQRTRQTGDTFAGWAR